MKIIKRISRHLRLTKEAAGTSPRYTPPFLIVFINSICNLACEHCFYWSQLNKRDDLTYEEFDRLTAELGTIENLNLSGGEPFMRPDFAEVVKLFITRNNARQIYVPTNGWYTEATIKALRSVLQEKSLEFFVCEISLDGTEAFHDKFRARDRSFAHAMETYDALAALQQEDPRLRIHAISTATHENIDELRALTSFLYERCPKMDHHNLAVIRGDRKNQSLHGPALDAYDGLYEHLRTVWHDREKERFGGLVDPMLHWAKRRTLDEKRQVVPCKAGRLTGVIHANGDVAVCENHPPLGNLRKNTFFEIWDSPETNKLRASIAAGACWCTNEVFLWPSVNFQPTHLAKALVGSRRWQV